MQDEPLNSAGTSASHRGSVAAPDRYWLAKHVYVCVTHHHVVMLDLQRDKYLAVTSPEKLTPWVAGWPVPSGLPGQASNAAGRDCVADLPIPASLSRLVRDGLLTSDPALGKTADMATMPRPSSALVQFRFGIRPRVKPRHAVTVGKAWLTARIAFGRLSLQHLVEQVQDRKTRARQGTWDAQQARDLVTAFLWLRPLYYTARDACLFDSLVLLDLLAQYEIFPTWVLGIKLAPFGAHCWVQDRDVVWNDAPERVGSYTPILCA